MGRLMGLMHRAPWPAGRTWWFSGRFVIALVVLAHGSRAAARQGALDPLDAGLPPPALTSSLAGASDPLSTDGSFVLSWSLGDEAASGAFASDVSFQIEEAAGDGEPLLIDAGPHLTSALSGRDDGQYRYRVRTISTSGSTGPWSRPIHLRVEHHSLSLALSLLALGAVVFLATASLVLLGHRLASRDESSRQLPSVE